MRFSLEGLRELHRLSLMPTDDFAQLYQAYLEVGCRMLGLSVGIVSRIRDQDYQVLAVQPADDGIRAGDHYALGDTYCSAVVKKRGSVALHHVGELEHMLNHPVYLAKQLESYIATPIFVQGRIFGTLNFSDVTPRDEPFRVDEMEFLELMARSLGRTLALDRLERQRRQAIRRMEESVALFEGAFRHAAIGMAIVSPDGSWLRVNPALCRILGYAEEALLEIDFQSITHPDDLETDLEHVQALLDGSKNSYWMKKRYFHHDGHVVSVVLAVSIVRNEDGSPRYFLSQIEDISAQASAEETLREQKAQLEKLNRKLADMARTDPLTGLCNRMVLMDALRREYQRSLRSGEALTVAFMDVDYFKQYNDDFGHAEGDLALKAVAAVLQTASRGSDLLTRYGGEEFVALLPGAGINQARAVADRLRVAVSRIGDLKRPITLSVGVATLLPAESPSRSPETLLRAADKALYAAKEAGRNRVEAVVI
ncbi:GAF/PAS/GGDEF domain-containing protein [Alcanivorax hongdengensis A-11-3]|uniref:diguanylate cyclase n=1 Tax=Alcanivorax hongdengensis A-11-3 TaxID=1177179 RepID=L0WCV0_9GAMM|nr:sensor domain-containing diguanylate cyclase [Alcanivorax hongdengensis]EKF74568.1 GAF/PAS/GGDEF domain-containing protein [Alcanivorax hongdengensis A-11-3]